MYSSIGLSRALSMLRRSQTAVTLSDLSEADQPLIFANDKFCEMTGYSEPEILNRNCRFLQGPETRRDTVDGIREDIQKRRHVFRCLANYRKGGDKFHNLLMLMPLDDVDVGRTMMLGCQFEFARELKADELQAYNEGLEDVGRAFANSLNDSEVLKLDGARLRTQSVNLIIKNYLLADMSWAAKAKYIK